MRVGDFPIGQALAADEIARKQGLVPDFDVLASGRPIVEPLNPGIVAATDPVDNSAVFTRTDLFAGIADEGLCRNGNGFRDLAGLVDKVVQELQEGAIIVEVYGDREAIFAGPDDVDGQGGAGTIGIGPLGHHLFFRRNAFEALTRWRKIPDVFKGDFDWNGVW